MTDFAQKENFYWFDLSNPSENKVYRDVWLDTPYNRPHDHPGFLELMKPCGYRPSAVVYHYSLKSHIIYPFYSCCLSALPAFNDIAEKFMHMVSSYGYGGPLFCGSPQEIDNASERFHVLFSQELFKRGYVTEFIREDIFSNRLVKNSIGQVIVQQPNIVVRLDRAYEEIWRCYKAKVRKNVNRAREHGLRVEFDWGGDKLDDFLKIYYETMARNNASKSFYVSRESFRKAVETLGKDGGLLYAHVYEGKDIISTELLLLSNDAIYSFLGGTLAAAFDKRPNDLLKHEVILWGAQKGFKWYVLGGGVTSGDGIYKYKEAFDKESIFHFSVRRIIHNPDAYELLIQAREKYEKSQGREWQPNPDFFPEFLS